MAIKCNQDLEMCLNSPTIWTLAAKSAISHMVRKTKPNKPS